MAITAQTTSIKLESSTRKRLQKLGNARRRSAHWLMKEAIRQYLDREEKREQLHRDAMAAWEDYQRTGLHVTGEEMEEWIDRLEHDPQAPLPKPHR